MVPNLKLLQCSTIILLLSIGVDGANILGIFPHASESHFAVMRSVVFELARREHTVTIYTSHRLTERDENIREIIIEPEYPFWTNLQKNAGIKNGIVALSAINPETLQQHLGATGAASIDYFLSNPAVQDLLELKSEEFNYDLIILDLFYSDAFLALGHLHKKPTIALVNTDFENYMEHVLESIIPMACSPIDFVRYEKDMQFWPRVQQIRECIKRRKVFAKSNLAAQEQLVKKHLLTRTDQQLPTIADLHAELAVLLVNNHVPLMTPRPILQNTILTGGLHIRAARELPWHVRRYLDDARFGVIYMNLGNEQLCSEIPAAKLQLLYKAFSESKLLWTCHDEDKLTNIPGNWMVQHMVPQADILAHPHVRVFVMNGDLLSFQEGVVRHVPMLGLPIFRNEKRNMQLAVMLHVGIQLDQNNLTVASLQWAYNQLTQDGSYATEIRKVSQTFRDRPLGGLETAMYWIDYVLRHNGGADIKTRGIGITSNQLHLFDLYIFYVGVAVTFTAAFAGIVFLSFVLWKRRKNQKIYSKLS